MKNIATLICLVLWYVSTSFAAEEQRITLDGKKHAPPEAVAKPGEKPSTAVAAPHLILFPAPGKTSHGTVLVSPGGAYHHLAVEKEGTLVAKMLNQAGWDSVVLQYRVNAGAATRQLALEDAKQALELIRKRGAEWSLETSKVGVMGFSAGGHLSARLAFETASARSVDFMVLIYPAFMDYKGILLKDVYPPHIPLFVYVAANDIYKSSAIALEAYCRENSLNCTYHLASSGGHGFGLQQPLPGAVKDWPEKLRVFLEKIK